MSQTGTYFKVSLLQNVKISNESVFTGNGAQRDTEEVLLHSVGLL